MAGLFDSITALLNPANPGGIQPTAAPADPGVIAAPAEADPTAAPDTGTILARLRQQALTQGMAPPPPMKGGGPLGLAAGPLPDVKGKNKFNAFVSGLSSGMNAQQTRGDAANAAARDQQKGIFDQWKTVAGIQGDADKLAETKAHDAALAKYYEGIVAAKDKESTKDPAAMTPHVMLQTEQAIHRTSGFMPGSDGWLILPDNEKARRYADYADKWQRAFHQPPPLDANGYPVAAKAAADPAAAAGATPAPAAPGAVPTPPTSRPNVTPQTAPAAPTPAPAPAPAPTSLVPVQGPNGERALWDPARKTFVPVPGNAAPGGQMPAPGGAMGGIDPSTAF